MNSVTSLSRPAAPQDCVRPPIAKKRFTLPLGTFLFGLLSSTLTGVTVWDESLHGDLSDSETSGTPIILGLGTNTIRGTVGGPVDSSPPGDFYDVVNLIVGPTLQVDSIILDAFGAVPGNLTSGFNFFDSANPILFLGSTTMSDSNIGDDLLLQTGVDVPLSPGIHVLSLRENFPGQSYAFTIYTSSIPEPSPSLLLAILGLHLCRHRRR